MDDYKEFLESKRVGAKTHGFAAKRVNANLFPFQKAIVKWALRLGRAAIFADTGLGKTLMQLAWADAIVKHTGQSVLILTPLAVAAQTVREAKRFKIKAAHASCQEEVPASQQVIVTNYQKLHHFQPDKFVGVVLDESSILKAFAGKTKRMLVESFRDTPYRLACTATPAPNDHTELGNHSEFLGVMDSSEMLSRWFLADQSHAGEYRLKGHAAKDYWQWVASWACCVSIPSDLGKEFSDDGYILPELNIVDHCVEVDSRDTTGVAIWRNDRLTATGLHKELRLTCDDRAAAVAETIGDSAGPWIVWCNTDYEADALKKVIPDAVEIRGSNKEAFKEKWIEEFADGKVRVLITKPTVAGFGLNWQHCCNMAFVGLSYSFEQFYQAVRRSWRFGQTKIVNAHVFFAETEGEVIATIRRKQHEANSLRANLVQAVRDYWHEQNSERELAMEFDTRTESGKTWEMRLGDCVELAKGLEDDSVDFTIFSPPFSNLYIYSDSYRDMGNTSDDAEFFKHFEFLLPELYRATTVGRLCAIHCKDLPKYRNKDGASALRDFPGAIIAAMERAQWDFHSRVTIWKCPVVERERTNNNGLLHKTVCRDSSQIRQGMADFLLVFRKTPKADNLSAKPIERSAGFTDWKGESTCDPRDGQAPHPSPFARKPGNMPRMVNIGTEDEPEMVDLTPSVNVWQRYADPVWWDIRQMDVLNVEQARDSQDEKHICPLQLGLIERSVELWTNPGDTVLSPFAGIGSEGYQSVLMKRKFIGFELKEAYFDVACRNLARAETEANQVTLFDDVEESEVQEVA